MDLHSCRRVLVCLRYGIGDVLMQMPALEALRRAAKRARIQVLGARPALQLFDGDDRVDGVVSIHDWGLQHWMDLGTPEIRSNLSDWLAGQNYDVILDLPHAVRAVREVAWGLGVPVVTSDSGVEAQVLRAGGSGRQAIAAGVSSGWRIEVPPEITPRLQLGGSDHQFVEQLLGTRRLGECALAAVSPVASSDVKRWSPRGLAAVMDGIAGTGRTPILIAGPRREMAREVIECAKCSERVLTIEEIPLKRVAALLARCEVLVCNDTGLMHLGAAVGTPVVAIFGPTDPRIYLPDSVPARAVGGWTVPCPHRIEKRLGPAPCVSSQRCFIAERSCIDRATAEEVMAATLELMRELRSH